VWLFESPCGARSGGCGRRSPCEAERSRSRRDGVGHVVVRRGLDRVGLAAGRGERWAGRVEAEVDEDLRGDGGLRDEGDEAEAPCALRTGEDVEGEDLLQQVGPGAYGADGSSRKSCTSRKSCSRFRSIMSW